MSRLTSPLASPGREVPPMPSTPDASARSRWRSSSHEEGSPLQAGDASPLASSHTASSGIVPRVFDSRSSLRNALQSNSSLSMINMSTPARRVIIRADTSIITCFDPADKELYDLWVPKR